jgi:hypothetical protein
VVLLFHGTTEDRIEEILRQGLSSPEGDPARGVFLSTSPVAGKGGDPVAFAFGWPVRHIRNSRRQSGYVVVVDLPPHEIGLVREVVTNTDFDVAWTARQIRRELAAHQGGGMSLWCLLYWFADSLTDRRISLESQQVADTLRTRVDWRDPALRVDLTPGQWTRFLDDYLHLMDVRRSDYPTDEALERERGRILAAHDIRLPDRIEEDNDSRSCLHCLSGAFRYDYEVTTLQDHQPYQDFVEALYTRPDRRTYSSATRTSPLLPATPLHRPLIDNLAYVLRAINAHTQPYRRDRVEQFFLQYESVTSPWTWQDWYTAFPNQAPGLPRAWTADYDRPAPVTPDVLRRPDSQVHALRIPAHLIIGTIQVTDGRRLVPDLRPDRRRGETLPSLLWRKAHQLHKRHNKTV